MPRPPVVRVAAEIDVATAPALDTAMQEQVDAGHDVLVLDLAGVTFLDSSGLGLFVAHHKTLRRRGGSVRLANASSRVLKVLTVTGLDQVFPVYPSVQAALDGQP
jgi:anti-sigma B factor antagonist